MGAAAPGVSVVVPVRNGATWIVEVIASIRRELRGRPSEVIVVDDGSSDESQELLEPLRQRGLVRVLEGGGRGAAAAINLGIGASCHPIICQIDQDVVLQPGWASRILAALEDPAVGAAQGRYVHDRGASFWVRVMALDLEQRYAALGTDTTHVCTGNTAYRRSALEAAGLFDEGLGYGYDNDMSYRLRAAGHRLVFCREARSTHHWRDGLTGYCRQQYGFGYGRLDVVARHPAHVTGDSVSPAGMMLHPVITAVVWLCAAVAVGLASVGARWWAPAVLAATLVAGLVGERAIAGVRAARRFDDRAALLFPVVHLLRDQAWVAAIAVWLWRRVARRSDPGHSMRPRSVAGATSAAHVGRDASEVMMPPAPKRILAVVPAHNEAVSLPAVVVELRRYHPDLDILVVDDGSTDNTVAMLDALGVRWLRLPERMGIGSAMRAGLSCAARLGFDGAVRVDGDGQHRANEIATLLAPLMSQRADVVLGSRYVATDGTRHVGGARRLPLRLLAAWLSLLTGRPVTDPTSGFCAFGPRAVRVLSEYHPSGYPEPELQLIAARHRLSVLEVPVRPRARAAGRTSLTPVRVLVAGARVLLALVLEPLRTR